MPTDFLWSTGTNGQVTSNPVLLMSTELVSMINSTSSTDGFATSVVTGSSGVFTAVQTGQALYGVASYYMGSPGATASALSAGANLAGWFQQSFDGGVTFESSLTVPPRAPDFLIPLPATTINSSTSPFMSSFPFLVPSMPFRVLVQNNTGQTLGGSSSSPYLKLAPITPQY
jgi:hypothetical protein